MISQPLKDALKKGASLFCITAFVVSALPISHSHASPKTTKSLRLNAYEKMEKEVEGFLAQKKRDSAINRVIGDFSSLTKEQKVQGYELYQKASRLFYQDRNQQIYESALFIKKTDPRAALEKVQQVLQKDQDHLSLRIEEIRLQIQIGQCDQSLQKTEALRQRIKFDEEINLLQAFSLFCVDKLTKTSMTRLQKESFKIEKPLIWKTLEGLNMTEIVDSSLKKNIQDALHEAPVSYPEADYLFWKMSLVEKLPRISSANKYLEACKNISGKQIQTWIWDPFLCRRTAEVESDLAKLNKKAKSSE